MFLNSTPVERVLFSCQETKPYSSVPDSPSPPYDPPDATLETVKLLGILRSVTLYKALSSEGTKPYPLTPCLTTMTLCKILIKSSELARELWSYDLPLKDFRYDFEYEDDDEAEAGDVGVENKYYNAKQMKVDNPDEAIQEFLGMPALEEEKGDWLVPSKTGFEFAMDTHIYILPRGFKGLKQAVKLEYKLGKYDKVRGSMVIWRPRIDRNPRL